MISLIKKAYLIARYNLRQNYNDMGIQAGQTHFADIWTRDCYFAAMGSLKLGDTEVVKAALETSMAFMKKNGQIPFRVGQKIFALRYFHLNKLFSNKPKGVYIEDKYTSIPTDSNSHFLIAFSEYVAATNDSEFLTKHYTKLKEAIQWNLSRADDDLLIKEGYFAGWADSIKKNGKVLYSNVLHYAALEGMSALCKKAEDLVQGRSYAILTKRIQESINKQFWNGDYFVDWIGKRSCNHFSTDGNVLAILYGLATVRQSEQIQDYIHNKGLDEGFSIESVFPSYSFWDVFKPFYLINLSHYHNGLRWLWLGCLDAVAKMRIGRKEEAIEHLERIAKKILEYEGVFEIYEETGEPFSHLFYKSEQGFAWYSGLFVWACHECGLVKDQ